MEYARLSIDQVELDLENPRIKQWIEMYGENISSEAIALALSASSSSATTSSYDALKESINVNKGLINPIIVNRKPDGKMVVIEGNTRLQIYKEFAVSDPNGPWKEIIAIVYDDLPDEEIHAIRLQTHLVGPRDWDPFSKAKYLHQLSKIDKMPLERIISFCGGKTSEINKLINAYMDMTKYYFPEADAEEIDPDPREFSKFSELQNKSITDALLAHQFTKEDFAKWVVKGNIDTAQNVRKLPAILADKTACKEFLRTNITEASKLLDVTGKNNKLLSSVSMDDLVTELTSRIQNIDWKEVKALKNNVASEDKKNHLFYLEDELNTLLDDLRE